MRHGYVASLLCPTELSETIVKDDIPHNEASAPTAAAGVSRRHLLGGAAMLGLAGITFGTMPIARAADSVTDEATAAFVRVSGVLTDRESLNPVLASLIFREMIKEDATLPESVAHLANVIHRPIEEWNTADQTLARQITSVWYTGLIGAGDRMRVVTFEGALQFAATQDIFIVRSYCPNRPGFWATQPSGWRA